MKKFAIIGVYGKGDEFTTGQAVKSYELINWFKNKFGSENITIVNTYKWKKNPLKLFRSLVKSFKECENIIMLPAQHGLKVFAPLCYYLNKKYKRKIEYVVIGGWLTDTLKANSKLKKYVSSFDGVFVETQSMVNKLKKIGIYKSFYLPNTRLLPNGIKRTVKFGKTINICTYSRVTEDKGIIDAIEIAKEANRIIGKEIFNLHIYGKISLDFQEKLDVILKENSEFVEYCGVKNADQGVETLSNYFCLLFPTYYEGEGFAGTVLDALAAGTPIVANDWKYNREILEGADVGYIYEYRNIEMAANFLVNLYKNKKLYNKLSKNAQKYSLNFSPENVYKGFIEKIK